MAFTENFRQIEFNPDKEIYETFRATQGDTKSQGFNVVVFLGGKKKVITTETMSFFAQKPDGTRVIDTAVKDGDGFKIELKNQVFAVPGVVVCTLVLNGASGEKLADRQFKILVAGSMEDGAIVSEDERGILDRAFDLAEDIVPRVEDLDIDLLENIDKYHKNFIGVENNVVTPHHVNFIKTSSNLCDLTDELKGYYLSPTGEPLTSTTGVYNTSQFILIEPKTTYTYGGLNGLAYYSEDKSFLGKIDLEYTGTTKLSPQNARYIRVHYQKNQDYKRIINKGDTLQPFQDFYMQMDTGVVVKSESLINNSVNSKKRTILGEGLKILTKTPPNFNTNNQTLTFSDNLGIIYRNKYHEIPKVKVIDFMADDAPDKSVKVVYFDTVTKDFITTNSTKLGWEVSEDMVLFAILFIAGIDKYNLYIDIEYTINGEPIYSKYKKDLEESPYYVSNDDLSGIISPSNFKGIGEQDSPFDYTNDNHVLVYNLFDSLMSENPDYISRETLATVGGNNEIPIYCYTFKPKRPGNAVVKPLPKIMFGGAIHGDENLAVTTIYYLMLRICREYENDQLLNYLRHNIEFKVVPLQNPIDYNAKAYIGSDGVNMNRNFDWGWASSNDPAKGSEPFSEKESRALRDYWINNKDIMHYIDCHVRGGRQTVQDTHLMWMAMLTSEQNEFVANMIGKLSRHWQKKYPELPNDIFLGYQTKGMGYTNTCGYSHFVLGIDSCTWEGFSKSTTMNSVESADIVNMNVDYLAQYVIELTKYHQSKLIK